MFFSFSKQQRRQKQLAEPYPEAWRAYLQENVFLHRLLSPAEQSRLWDAVRIFIAEKFWEGGAGLAVTDEMKVTIAGHACLLTLGFEDYYFDELKTVLVYPGSFLSLAADPLGDVRVLGARLGEAHHNGPVILSWWQTYWDGRRLGESNLVLHEFAHKLAELGEPEKGMPVIKDPQLEDRWQEVMKTEYDRLVEDATYQRPTLLDPYGAENRAEFFAVATECFFLQPTELRRRHESLYQLLAEWYRQDPAVRRVDATLTAQAQDAEEQYARHIIAEATDAIRKHPDYLDAYSQRADGYCHLEEFERALEDCTTLIRLAPREARADAYHERGLVHLAAGSYDLAVADFTEAIDRSPDFAEAYRDRGSARAAKGKYQKALTDLTHALRLDPRDHETYRERAFVYYDLEKYDQALRDLSRVIRLAPSSASAYGDRAWVHLAMREYDQAIADCNEAIRLSPAFPEAYKHRGVAYFHQGAYDQAIDDFNEAIRIDPNYASAFRARAEAYQAKGEGERARRDLDQAENLEGNEGD